MPAGSVDPRVVGIKEMPSHKRFRKRRLVVDYRRVNARVKRSTYYCRRSTNVLAAAVGSVWYTFVDAVSVFNQIRSTERAREVLAIGARSGKYLPVGLTCPMVSTLWLIEPSPLVRAASYGSQRNGWHTLMT